MIASKKKTDIRICIRYKQNNVLPVAIEYQDERGPLPLEVKADTAIS